MKNNLDIISQVEKLIGLGAEPGCDIYVSFVNDRKRLVYGRRTHGRKDLYGRQRSGFYHIHGYFLVKIQKVNCMRELRAG